MVKVSRFGSCTVAKVGGPEELGAVLPEAVHDSETVIVKPNFVDRAPGTYTDPESLRMLFTALESRIVVVEGHQLVRVLSEGEDGLRFEIKGKTRDWSWMHRGEWSHFEKNNDWGWFRDGPHWSHLKRLDRGYMDEKGFTEFDAEYVNVTDEVWGGDVADPVKVREIVEARYSPLFDERLYGYMPEKLYRLRGSCLISYSKYKHYATFTLKYMFGLIPDPLRCWWHGPQNSRMSQSVIGVSKLYGSLFDVVGVHESLGGTPVAHPEGEITVPGFRYNLHEGLGVVGVGTDRVELDTVMCGLGSYPLSEAEYMTADIGELGCFSQELYEECRGCAGEWLPPMAES